MDKRQELAFREYVDASMRRHYRVAWSLCGDHHDAEDLVQHALVQLYKHWTKVAREGSPDGYVRTTLTHRFIDTRRSAHARHEIRTAELPEDEPTEAALLADRVVDGEVLREALLALPPVERSAVVLRYVADQSLVDVADALGYSVSQTKRHLASGLRRLRTSYETSGRRE